MTKNFKKSALAVFLGLSVFAGCQLSEAVALVEHKEINKSNVKVLIPSIKKGVDSEVMKRVNNIFDKTVNDRLDEYMKDLKKTPSRYTERYMFYSSYAVKFNKNNLFSMAFDSSQYTGGAHGMEWRDSVTTNLKTGKILKLSDIFKRGSNYEMTLNQKVREIIAVKQYRQDDIKFVGVDDSSKFYLTEELLVIYYQPYDIAAYVYGIVEFYIPNSDIQDLYKDEINVMLQKS